MDKRLSELEKEARRLLPEFGTHGFEHTQRVYAMCQRLGKIEKANLKTLLPAALLHDITREEENHADAAAKACGLVLERFGYSKAEIDEVAEIICTHSFSGGKKPTTLEGKILSDADKLDALGALGIYRAALYGGEHGRPIEEFVDHFHSKLLMLKGYLFTKAARRTAEARDEYMRVFLVELDDELKGRA